MLKQYAYLLMGLFSLTTTVNATSEVFINDESVSEQAALANVTFKVDMNQYTGSFTTVNVNGTFNGWCGGCNAMTDPDGDRIYETTIPLNTGTIEYKFTVDGWTGEETLIPGMSCTLTIGPFTNRVLTFSGDIVLDAVCWNSCTPCASNGSKNVTFTVDVSSYTASYSGIFLNGDFNGWCGSCTPMVNQGNDIWTVTVPISADSIEYKFTSDGWTDQENFVGGELCTRSSFGFTNRFARLNGDTALAEVCWNSCINCSGVPASADVTFRVDMSTYSGSWTEVNLNGTFNGWCGSCALMSDADGDSIYELTVNVPTTGIEYKFTVDGWTDQESLTAGDACVQTTGGFTNRYLLATGDTVLPSFCWESCQLCSPAVPPTLYNVTFGINMSTECEFDSLDIVGDFNNWPNAAIAKMLKVGGSLFTATIPVSSGLSEYKFRKWVNGQGVYESITNRSLNLSGDISLPTACFNNVSGCQESSFDSLVAINSNKGVYRAFFSGLSSSDDYRLEFKGVDDATWRTKSITDASVGSQRFNVTPSFGTTVLVRLSLNDGGTWTPGCEVSLVVPCKNQGLSMVVQREARCTSDSVLVRAGYAGGYGLSTFLWSNGATTKRTYASQGEKLVVTVTDATGCSVSDSITAPVFDNVAVPLNFTLTKDNATTFTGSWTAPSLPSGATLIGYRMAYRMRNTQSYTNLPTTTNTSTTVDFTGTGLAAGNYEFVVFTRYNDGAVAVNSNFSCVDVKGYNGSGNKADWSGVGGSTSLAVSVYPNPTSGELYASAPQGSEVVLMDINGRVIASQVIENSETKFDMSALSEGVYMLRVQTSNEIVTKRIIKD
jgi:hypothetical protein